MAAAASAAISAVQQLVQQLRGELKSADPRRGVELLAKAKIALTQFQLPPFLHEVAAVRDQQLALARETYEIGVQLAIAAKDTGAFERNVAQVRVYYFDLQHLMKPSEAQWMVLGLNLVHLLTSNRLADFHAELELIPIDKHQNVFIAFAVHLEQRLMEGSYNKVLAAARQPPSPHFALFMDKLVHTVRARIAESMEAAYETLSLADAGELLLLGSEDQVRAFAAERKWKLDAQTRTLRFHDGSARRDEVPVYLNMERTLKYAAELEKIV
jgi:26S proteasome regulatory subunit N12